VRQEINRIYRNHFSIDENHAPIVGISIEGNRIRNRRFDLGKKRSAGRTEKHQTENEFA